MLDARGDAQSAWSPYLAGGLSGILAIASVWVAGKYLGASTSFVRSAGLIETIFGPERVAEMPYFMRYVPRIDWQWMFVIGILAGSLISAFVSGTFRWQALPDMWRRRFGPLWMNRGIAAFAGGAIAMFGARLAGG